MSRQSAPLAILFVDVAGSVGLYERLGDEAAFQAIEESLTSVGELAGMLGGKVLKSTGDGLLAIFTEPDCALEAAYRVQIAPPPDGPVSLRQALHWGEALVSESDVYGDAVNVAARLLALARPGEVLVTEELERACGPVGKNRLRPMPELAISGRVRGARVFSLTGPEEPAQTVLPLRDRSKTPERILLLAGLAETIQLSTERTLVRVGREAGNELVFHQKCVSRRHATLRCELRRFVLVDHSANGTFVGRGEGEGVCVHRERTILDGEGWLAFGGPRSAAPTLDFCVI